MKIEPTTAVSSMLANAAQAAYFLKKVANPNRLMIVCALVGGERSVRDLEDTLGIRQPGLSQQIAELRKAGLIAGRKESKSVFYRLADERVAEFVAMLHRMFCETPATEKQVQSSNLAAPRHRPHRHGDAGNTPGDRRPLRLRRKTAHGDGYDC